MSRLLNKRWKVGKCRGKPLSCSDFQRVKNKLLPDGEKSIKPFPVEMLKGEIKWRG